MAVTKIKNPKIIKEKREESGMSAKELAEKVGISSVALYYIENGGRNPHLTTLKCICYELGVSIDVFLETED